MAPERFERADALRENLQALFGLGTPSPEDLSAILAKVVPEDVAAILEDFPTDDKIRIFRALPTDESRGVVIEETDQESHDQLLEEISSRERIAVLGEMPVDDLVDHLEEIPAEERAQVLANLEPEEARDVEELAQFAPDSAGGLMTTEFLAVASTSTSQEALQQVQGNLDAETISYVYAIEGDQALQGVVSIRDLLRAKPRTPIADYMVTDLITVDLDTDQEEVARVANTYNLHVVPVVDGNRRLRGIVTADDILDAVEEEHSEDMLRMAGTVAVHPYHESIVAGALKRLPFLFVTMTGGVTVMGLVHFFEGRLPERVALWAVAALPLVCALAGNVAIVASTVMVRGLATGEINQLRAWKALSQETSIGLVVGIVLAGAAATAVLLLPMSSLAVGANSSRMFLSVALGLLCSILWASFVGAMVPVLCRMSGRIDPAIASGPFVTMLCDLSASFIFLWLVIQMN